MEGFGMRNGRRERLSGFGGDFERGPFSREFPTRFTRTSISAVPRTENGKFVVCAL